MGIDNPSHVISSISGNFKMKIVKPILILTALLQSTICFSGAYDCGKWEYAKFKAASKKKLIENYCDWKSTVTLNTGLIEIEKGFQAKVTGDSKLDSQKNVIAVKAGSESCNDQASEAAEMLLEKYKSPPPTVKECACIGSGSQVDVNECRKGKVK